MNRTDRGRPSLGVDASFAGGSAGFSFPLLSVRELRSCLADLGVPLPEEALTEPQRHKEAIHGVFLSLVELCMGVRRDELAQPAFSGLQALQYPELHEESIPKLAFFRAVGRMMHICGVRDFSVKDVLDPQPKRLRRCLSAAMNFCKFREERLVVFQELMGARAAEQETLETAKAENEALKQRLAELRQAREAEADAIETERAACDALAADIERLNRRQADLKTNAKALKGVSAERKAALRVVGAKIAELQTERDQLRGQVVASPARERAELDAAAAALEAEREAAEKAETEATEAEARLAAVRRAQENLRRCEELLEDLLAEKGREEAALQELAETTKGADKTQEKIAEGQVTVQHLQRELERQKAKVENLSRHGATKGEAAETALKEAVTALTDAREGQKQSLTELQDAEAEARRLEAELEAVKRHHKEEMQRMLSAYGTLEGAVRKHHEALRTAMSATPGVC